MKMQGNHERGQITVLFVLGIIALFGAASLAIDGGRLYLTRREAQSAADDAAMTGALAIVRGYSGPEIGAIALNRAAENGFGQSEDWVTVEVYWPPREPNPYAGDWNHIQVIITAEVPAIFAHFVFNGPLQLTVEAVAHAVPSDELTPGFAIFGANASACRTLVFSGNPTVDVSGGGSMGSNSDAACDCDPEGKGGSGANEGKIRVKVNGGGDITAAGCWGSYGTAGVIKPDPDEGVQQLNMDKLGRRMPIPDCRGMTKYGPSSFNGEATIYPGVYESLKFTAGADVTLKPGLYCIYGSDPWVFETKGGSTIRGDGVMFYLMSTAGGWKSAGGSQIYLNAPTKLTDASGNQWADMLIYAHPDNTNDIVLTGTSNSWYEGSVIAMGSHCDVEGNGGAVAFKTQVICDTVRVNGTGDLELFYEKERNYHYPATVELSK
jgi:hypothetical protein